MYNPPAIHFKVVIVFSLNDKQAKPAEAIPPAAWLSDAFLARATSRENRTGE